MTPEELHHRIFDFRLAAAVFAGVDLGLFAALVSGPIDACTLATKAGCDRRGVEVWLSALRAAGVVREGTEGWEVEPGLEPALDPSSEHYLGHLFQHDLWHWTRWAGLSQTLITGRPSQRNHFDRHLSDPLVLRQFLPNYNLAMEESARGAADRIAAFIAQHPARRVADFGGGTGELLIATCRRMPDVRGILVDHAFALEDASERIESASLTERIRLVDLDFERNALDEPYDVAVLSRVLMGFSRGRAARAVASVATGLEPGGMVLVHDFAVDSLAGAMLGLDMFLNTGGSTHSRSEIERFFEAAGLVACGESPVLPHTRLWIGRKEVAS